VLGSGSPETFPDVDARRPEGLRGIEERRVGAGDGSGDALGVRAERLEVGHLRRDLRAVLEDRLDARAVAAEQRGDLALAMLERVEPRVVGLDVVAERREVRDGLREVAADRRQPFGDRDEDRVLDGCAAQCCECRADALQRTRRPGGRARRVDRTADRVRMREPVDVLVDRAVTLWVERCGVDLVALVPQQLEPPSPGHTVVAEHPLASVRRRPARVGVVVALEHGEVRRAAVLVEQAPLHGGALEPYMFMLPVDLDVGSEQGAQDRGRHEPPTHTRPAATGGRDLARDDERPVLGERPERCDLVLGDGGRITDRKVIQPVARRPLVRSGRRRRRGRGAWQHRRHTEDRLDDRGVDAAPDEVGRRTRTEQQLQAVTSIVLPAPVSPVMTVSPGPSTSEESSMTPSPRMWSSSITTGSPWSSGAAATAATATLRG
jgi:hypothetical protein